MIEPEPFYPRCRALSISATVNVADLKDTRPFVEFPRSFGDEYARVAVLDVKALRVAVRPLPGGASQLLEGGRSRSTS